MNGEVRIFANGWIDKVTADLDAKVKALTDDLKTTLSYIGERAVTIARDRGDYNDITGNLRSSIGYVVLHDGVAVETGQMQTYSGTSGNGEDGNTVAMEVLERAKAEFPSGIVLIVCAGMQYASYVEDIHGKDVLTSARLETEQIAERMIGELLK